MNAFMPMLGIRGASAGWWPSARAWLALWLVLLAACTPARREVEGDLVAGVRFEGNGGPLSGHNDYQLRSQMEQGTSAVGVLIWPLMYFATPEGLDRAALGRDAYRLEVWYAHNGWFDARFNGWQIRRLRNPGKHRAAVVELIGSVEPGPPSLFGSFEIGGLDRTTQLFGNTVKRTGSIQAGSQFNLESVYATRDQLIQTLHDHARAYATVSVDMTARPQDQTVDVVFDVVPGLSAHFGEIVVEGAATIDEAIIRETLGFEAGEPYGLSKLAKGQRRLFDLGTFAVVNISPDLTDPSREAVPVLVRVLETRFQRIRFGGGGDYDGQSVTPRASFSYRHVNLFNRLLRFDLGASAGLGIGLGQSTALQPIFHTSMGLSTPRLFGPDWTLSLNAGIRQDLQNGQFAYRNPATKLDLGWRPSDYVALGFGPSWELYQFLELETDRQLDIARALFGADFKNPYQLFTLDARFSLDWRDDPIFTRRGSLYRLSVRHALPVPARDNDGQRVAGFHYTEISGDARAYRPLRFKRRTTDLPWSYAARLQGRLIHNWSSRGVPYPERIFMGGANDVRGFRGQQMGLYDVLCLYEAARTGSFRPELGSGTFDNGDVEISGGQDLNRIELPHGGLIAGSTTLELRYDWAYGVTWAVFSDLGFLVDEYRDLVQFGDALRVSAGVGARYKSLIGPIRIDLAFRPLYPEDLQTPTYLSCYPGDSTPRNFDLLTRWRRDERDAIPVAVNLLLAIGEAL